MYLRVNKGPNVEHCGTPEITCLVMEQRPSNFRKELNQLLANPRIP